MDSDPRTLALNRSPHLLTPRGLMVSLEEEHPSLSFSCICREPVPRAPWS